MQKNELKVKRLKDGFITFFKIKGENVFNVSGKRKVYCGCTGNTEETATPMKFKNGKIYCPNCHEKKVEILETYEDYLKRKELENQKELENLRVILAGEDWECGLKFYTLSARLCYDDWLKVKKYFTFKSRGWSSNEELEFDFVEPTGWITRDGYNVQKILFEEGLIKKENLREFEEWECNYKN